MKFPNDRLEEFFQNSLKDFGAEPPEDMWERMEPFIPPKPKKKPFWRNFNGLILFALLVLLTSVSLISSYELKISNLENRIAKQGQSINLIPKKTAITLGFNKQYFVGNDLEHSNDERSLSEFFRNAIANPNKTFTTKKSATLTLNKNSTNILNNSTTISNLTKSVQLPNKQKLLVKANNQENKIISQTNFVNKEESTFLTNNTTAIPISKNQKTSTNNALASTSWINENFKTDLVENNSSYSFNKEQKNTKNTHSALLKKVAAIAVSDFSLTKRKTPKQQNSIDKINREYILLPKLKSTSLAQIPLTDLEEFKMPIKPFHKRPRIFLEISFMPFYATSNYNSELVNITNQQNSQSSINSSALLGIQLVSNLDLTLELGLGKRKVNQLSQFTKDFYYIKNEATHQQNYSEAIEYTFELNYSIGKLPYRTKIRSTIDNGENNFIASRSFIVDYETNHELSFLQIPLFLQYRMGHKRLKYTLKGGVIINRLLKDSFSIDNVTMQDENTKIRISALGSSHYLAGSKWANMNLLFSAGLEYQIRPNLFFIFEPSLIRGQKPFYLKKYPWVAALNMGLRVQL